MAKVGRKPKIKTAEEIKQEVLYKKIRNIKAMLQCVRIVLKSDGNFRTCAGCDDQFLCGQIKRKIEQNIRKVGE